MVGGPREGDQTEGPAYGGLYYPVRLNWYPPLPDHDKLRRNVGDRAMFGSWFGSWRCESPTVVASFDRTWGLPSGGNGGYAIGSC